MSDSMPVWPECISTEETEKRISFCSTCEHCILDVIPKCDLCDCSISLLTTATFKSCSIGKW